MLPLDSLTDLLQEYVESPDNPDINFDIALEYEKLGQFASAITFYLRAAEFGYESAPNIAYVSLLKVGLLLEALTNRDSSVLSSYLHAVTYQPNRPEAYFLLAKHYEKTKSWRESYAYAVMGQQFIHYRSEPTLANVGYRGEYCLIFQQAVAAWWVGRQDEARVLFERLLSNFSMDETFIKACKNNLELWKD